MRNEVKEQKEFLRRKNYDPKLGKKSKLDFPVPDFKKFNLEYFKSMKSNLENDYHYSGFNSIDGNSNVKLVYWFSENLLVHQDEIKHLWKLRRIVIMTVDEIKNLIYEGSLSQIFHFNRIGTDLQNFSKRSESQSKKIYQLIRNPKN